MPNVQQQPLPEAPPMGPAFEAVGDAMRNSLLSMSEWTRETARFLGDRLEKDAELQRSLARCTNPFEAFTCLTKFAGTAVADYSREAARANLLLYRLYQEGLVDAEAELMPVKAPALE